MLCLYLYFRLGIIIKRFKLSSLVCIYCYHCIELHFDNLSHAGIKFSDIVESPTNKGPKLSTEESSEGVTCVNAIVNEILDKIPVQKYVIVNLFLFFLLYVVMMNDTSSDIYILFAFRMKF